MIVFFSGNESLARPEIVLGDRANIMRTMDKFAAGPDKRMKAFLKSRKRRGGKKK